MGEEYQLITCVVQRGKADAVWAAARDAGASGATVYFGRGMGVRDRLGLLAIAISAEKEVVQMVVRTEELEPILGAMTKAGKLDVPGMGFAFCQPVHHAIGFASRDASEQEGG